MAMPKSFIDGIMRAKEVTDIPSRLDRYIPKDTNEIMEQMIPLDKFKEFDERMAHLNRRILGRKAEIILVEQYVKVVYRSPNGLII